MATGTVILALDLSSSRPPRHWRPCGPSHAIYMRSATPPIDPAPAPRIRRLRR